MSYLISLMGTNGATHTSAELMQKLMAYGYSFESARGIIGISVAKGFITAVYEDRATKIYV